MKSTYVRELLEGSNSDAEVHLLGWVQSRRISSNVVFLDVCDSTGTIQVVIGKGDGSSDELLEIARKVPLESAIEIRGQLCSHVNKKKEIKAIQMVVIAEDTLRLSPQPRSRFDIFDEQLADHLLRNRHIYIRNPKVMAILKFRNILMIHMRRWFENNQFMEIDAPILTPVPLYEDGSAISVNIDGDKVFLTQCVGYYLEAAVHAFERVYNMGPSFRGEESRSKRHLMEYWHIKAEMAFGGGLDGIIRTVEDVISYLTRSCWESAGDIPKILGTQMCLDGLEPPFPRISYENAIQQLRNKGLDIVYGKGLGSKEEELLSKDFQGPFWITGIPRSIEPFPYVVDPNDPRITRVADLIASNGYGELLGVAEKIHAPEMLDERMDEKGKLGDPRYEWVRQVHQSGCVPHVAFGMGLERLMRWMLNIPHVRDAIPFPRIFRRKILP